MRITTLPVYSKLADPADIPEKLAPHIPAGWRLSQHQLETYRALTSPDVDVVINTAMTGDGKSLAGLLPLLAQQQHTLALYPTNELIRDQLQSAGPALPRWNKRYTEESLTSLFGARLDELCEEQEYGRRGDHLLALLRNYPFVLSNPDIFHAILQFSYQQYGRAPDWLVPQMIQLFQQITFDEFHIFDSAQVAAVLSGLLLLYELKGNYPLKTLFLSATPGGGLGDLLKQTRFDGRVALVEGSYLHANEADPQRWRPILQPCGITFSDQTAHAWLDAHLEDTLLAFFQRHGKHAKGAIIVNSVATAHLLLARLQPIFAQHGLTILPNTGITGQRTKAASRQANVLIGTSTVDVGVDFQINFLLFESGDAETFIQRLGRLGRHQCYTDAEGTTYPFHEFEAHALVPPFLHQRLTRGYKDQPAHIENGQRIQRDQLNAIIRSCFTNVARFEQYLADWGRFQPWQMLSSLSDKRIKEHYQPLALSLRRQYGKLFRASMGGTQADAASYKAAGLIKLVDEARSFRGSSPFMCGIFFSGEPEPLGYDLFWLLANAELEPTTKEAFLAEIERRHMGRRAFEAERILAYFHVRSLRQEREDTRVDITHMRSVQESIAPCSAQVVHGLQIDALVPWDLNALNRHIKQRHFVATFVPSYHPLDLRRELWLPTLFPLHAYRGAQGEGCIAFGRQALMLDSILRKKTLRQIPDSPLFR